MRSSIVFILAHSMYFSIPALHSYNYILTSYIGEEGYGKKMLYREGICVYKKEKRAAYVILPSFHIGKKINIIYGKNLVNILLVRIRREGTAPAAKRLVSSRPHITPHVPFYKNFTIKELNI